MTQLLKKAIQRAQNLPPAEQDRVAQRWLEEMGEIEPNRPTPYDRIAHLAGVLKDGPADLSTNKQYLEGLGERSMR
jgi:hypothetical protein